MRRIIPLYLLGYLLLYIISGSLLSGCAAPNFYRAEPSPLEVDYADDVPPVQEIRLSSEGAAIPDNVIDVSFFESITAHDFFSMLSDAYDVSFVVSVPRDLALTVPRYIGSLTGLLSALERSHGLVFHNVGGSILVSLSSEKIFREMIHLDVAFVEYEISAESDIGIDPKQIRLALDRAVSAAAKLSVSGVSGLTISLSEGSVSLAAVLASLEQYNRYHTLQRVSVGGMAGQPLTIDVSNKIPYVDSVTVQAGQSGPTQRGYTFAEAASGLVLSIDLSTSGDLILANSNLRYQDVQSYLDVGSGEDKFSRPVTSARNVQSYVTLQPGSVVQLARVRYTKQIDSATGFYGLNQMLRGKQERNYEIVVLARGTIKRYYR